MEMLTFNRRAFFAAVAGTFAAANEVDLERLVWTPGEKHISIPKVLAPVPIVRGDPAKGQYDIMKVGTAQYHNGHFVICGWHIDGQRAAKAWRPNMPVPYGLEYDLKLGGYTFQELQDMTVKYGGAS